MSNLGCQDNSELMVKRVKKLAENGDKYEKIAGIAIDHCEKLVSERKSLKAELESYQKRDNGKYHVDIF